MRISPDQAIEIQATVLKYWHHDRAPQEARARALDCATAGDFERFQAWARIAKLCDALRAVEPPEAVDLGGVDELAVMVERDVIKKVYQLFQSFF